MDDPEKDEDLDESGFGHDPIPKKGKGNILPDDDVDAEDTPIDEDVSGGEEDESLEDLEEKEDAHIPGEDDYEDVDLL